MGKLTGVPLEFAAKHMTNCRKHGYKKYRVLVEADSNANGKTLCTYLQEVYRPEDIADYSGGYKDFSLVFGTVWRRDEVVKEINNAVAQYRIAHPDAVPTYGNASSGTGDDTPGPQKKTSDWSTYLIVGAAVVALILLLLNRIKK